MLKIGDKTFLNLQEAVGWLLENNCIPFQCTAPYAANTEIGMGAIVNPSPAKVRIGSIIFFADSKVSTVIGLTENGFICSDKYNNLVDDIAYVTGVSINGSGHLITTLSDGQTIDAGIIKQVSNFSINGSQHLIANYNDGTSTDLGAIFQGNVSITGTLAVSSGITSPSILETNTGYSWHKGSTHASDWTTIYAGIVKTGNKLTFVVFGSFTATATVKSRNVITLGSFYVPSAIGAKLYPYTLDGVDDVLDNSEIAYSNSLNSVINGIALCQKPAGTEIKLQIRKFSSLTEDATYMFRYEHTFLLSENLAS